MKMKQDRDQNIVIQNGQIKVQKANAKLSAGQHETSKNAKVG
jgi:hypothetical protein